MIRVMWFLVAVGFVGCATSEYSDRKPASVVQENPELPTIWDLQAMARNQDFDKLNDLFNNGLNIDHLPVGYSAGAAANVLGATGDVGRLLENFTGDMWRGKIFASSENPHRSQGLNRIMTSGRVGRMARFETHVVKHHDLTPDAKSSLVVLNYAHPASAAGTWVEEILTKIQVYDVMVAIPGRWGPVYIGKTWLGRYDNEDRFVPDNADQLVAWFFLDFSPQALREQRRKYWPSGKWDGPDLR